MKTVYHRSITVQALEPYFDPAALESVVAANLGQDALRYQLGHDHFHYDNNAFVAGDAYLDQLRRAVTDALQRGEGEAARQFLGRLTHTAQDFYAHSNYISLWRELYPQEPPEKIHPQLVNLVKDPRLRSGRLYFPLEVFSFIPVFQPHVLPLLPRDSHAWMNLDDPSRPNFEYAFAAAVKRTRNEYLSLTERLSGAHASLLTGKRAEG